MKQRIIILASLMLVGVTAPVWADLAAMERHIYAQEFASEPVEARLSRLEMQVFGQALSGGPAEREARLEGALKSVLTRPLPDPMAERAPLENGAQQPPTQALMPVQPEAPPKLPDATDYPTVTALEREVFGRDFIHDDISKRLSRLERKVFRQDYPQVALIDRVDKLLMRYPGVRPAPVVPAGGGNSVLSSLPGSSDQFVGSRSDTYSKLGSLERKLFGQENADALITERLDALESRVFARTYSGQSVDTRLGRLLKDYSVTPGGQSATQPFGVQPRPGFQPRPSMSSSGSYSGGYTASAPGTVILPGQPAPPARQNIQIGAGMSSTSTYQFSPELLDMLPNDVRGQFQGQAPMGGQAMGGGTVVYQERTISPSYSGFQTYGPGGLSYQNNYYGAPGMGTTVQQRTYSTTMMVPPAGNAAYTGNPAVIQQLTQLEIQVLGQPNLQEPVPIRLSRLESTLGGQMYPSSTDEARLQNLQALYRQHAISRLLGVPANGGVQAGPEMLPGGNLLGIPLRP